MREFTQFRCRFSLMRLSGVSIAFWRKIPIHTHFFSILGNQQQVTEALKELYSTFTTPLGKLLLNNELEYFEIQCM